MLTGLTPSVYEAGVGQPYEIGGVAVYNVHEAGTDSEIHEIGNPRVVNRGA